MTRLNASRIKVALVSTLLVAGLMATPARAHHNHNYLAPLAGLVLLNSLFQYGYGHHYGYSRHRHHHRNHYYGHSYSHDGYSHRSKRIYTKRYYRY